MIIEGFIRQDAHVIRVGMFDVEGYFEGPEPFKFALREDTVPILSPANVPSDIASVTMKEVVLYPLTAYTGRGSKRAAYVIETNFLADFIAQHMMTERIRSY